MIKLTNQRTNEQVMLPDANIDAILKLAACKDSDNPTQKEINRMATYRRKIMEYGEVVQAAGCTIQHVK